jgi:hypothetical protein
VPHDQHETFAVATARLHQVLGQRADLTGGGFALFDEHSRSSSRSRSGDLSDPARQREVTAQRVFDHDDPPWETLSDQATCASVPGPAGRRLSAAESGEMANVEQCRVALDDLIAALASVDPILRAKHVPERTVACRIDDLDITFLGQLDEHGVHDLTEHPDSDVAADVRVTMSSDQLVALAEREDDFLHAWLRGRVQVSASMRDLLRLRSLFSA